MSTSISSGSVVTVSSSAEYTMSKPTQDSIVLVKGLGVESDAHSGVTVKHRSRVRRDPTQPNLRQVHLIHRELHAELKTSGFDIKPGQMGENILTVGIDLLSLTTNTVLTIGDTAVVKVTGLRNPCSQLDGLVPGLMQAVLDRDDAGNLIRKAGIMSVVVEGGEIKPGDRITATAPADSAVPLEPV